MRPNLHDISAKINHSFATFIAFFLRFEGMMDTYDGATIEIKNWLKFNPRLDSKRPEWFRFDNQLGLGPKLFGLNAELRWVWIIILCQISEANGQPIVWNGAFVEANTGINGNTQKKAIDIFIEKFDLHVSRASVVRDTHHPNTTLDGPSPLQDKTRHNKTNTSSNKFDYPDHFEEIYNSFPRKEGKQAAYKIYLKECSSLESRIQLRAAVANYRVRKAGTETRFLLLFSTFMAQWGDWLDKRTGSSDAHSLNMTPLNVNEIT